MYIGVDIGGTNVKVGIISKLGRIVKSTSFKTHPPISSVEMIDKIVETIHNLCNSENIDFDTLEGVGFGIPGIVNVESGLIVKATNLHWDRVDFIKQFKEKMNIKSVLDNDANCAAIAEYKFGGGRDHKNLVFITIGTGIGSGIIIDGKLMEGNGSAGGECGHMVIVYHGEQCNCGNRGCWERYASASALTRQVTEAGKQNPNSKINDIIKQYGGASAMTAFQAARMKDEAAQKVVDQYVEYVACGLLNLTQIFHPEAFIIGGGVSNEGQGLIMPLQKKISNFIKENNFYPSVEVKKAVLGNDAGMVGAACLVMD